MNFIKIYDRSNIMKYRFLGNSKLKISEIGFGAWAIGKITSKTPGYYGANDKDSIHALEVAYDKGINFFDTSNIYGDGHSEKLIGMTFRKKRDKIIISSKGGCLPHKSQIMPQDFSKKYLTKELEKTLKRLKTDYLDVYLMHSPKTEDLEKYDFINTLKKFQNAGKIRFFGISCRSPQDGLKFINETSISCLQVNYNLIDQRIVDNGLLKLANKKGIGIIGRTPLVFGFLTKKISYKTDFKKKDDFRSNFSKKLKKQWDHSTKYFQGFYEKYNVTPAQFAIRFCLDNKNISSIIPGMINENEVLENVYSSKIHKISRSDNIKIRKIYKSNFCFEIKEIQTNKKK
jgi:aryl-alcohol dehydrogenase-like predicted oxidoreductase